MTIVYIKRVGAIDAAIGFRLRQIRQTRNLSQREVAERLGVTFQQIQKYEQGQTRISVATLVLIAHILGTDPGDILSQSISLGSAQKRVDEPAKSMSTSTLDHLMMALWPRLQHVRHRQLVLEMMRTLLESDA